MAPKVTQVKLERGTAARLARRFRLSHNHVNLCMKGQRSGRTSLMAAIERERQKQRGAA